MEADSEVLEQKIANLEDKVDGVNYRLDELNTKLDRLLDPETGIHMKLTLIDNRVVTLERYLSWGRWLAGLVIVQMLDWIRQRFLH